MSKDDGGGTGQDDALQSWHRDDRESAGRRKRSIAAQAAGGLRREFWNEIEAGIPDEQTRGLLAEVLKNQRLGAVLESQCLRGVIEREQPFPQVTDVQILNALRDRESRDALLTQLQSILDEDATTSSGARRRWRNLLKWGRRLARSRDGRQLFCFKDSVMARRMYPDPDSPRSPELMWASELQAAAEALWPFIHIEKLDVMSVHRFKSDIDALLDGQEVDIAESSRALGLIVDELEKRENVASALEEQTNAGQRPQRASSSEPCAEELRKPRSRQTNEVDGAVNPHDLIQQKVAAAILGKKAPELSDWTRKIKETAWVHPSWMGKPERFHYLLEQFPGGLFLRSRIVELELWLKDVADKASQPGRRRGEK